jgi:integrase
LRSARRARGVIRPAVQYPAKPLKTETSRTPIPVPRSLTETLSVHLAARLTPGDHLLWNEWAKQLAPWVVERAVGDARVKLAEAAAKAAAEGKEPVTLPEGFRFQDLRHFFASLLIASAANVRSYRPGYGTRQRRHRSTPTATCGPMRTSRPGPPWMRSWSLVRTTCGPRR